MSVIRWFFDWLVPDRALRGIGVEASTMPVVLTASTYDIGGIRYVRMKQR